jgi:exonuclease VII small subunit
MRRRKQTQQQPDALEAYRHALAAKKWCDRRLADAHVELETATREAQEAQAHLLKARHAWEASEA